MPDLSILRRLDLNLLVVLAELLRSRNVSRTAERLGRTQPAISLALSRLREVFDDPLLIRSGSGMRLSPLAEALRDPLTSQLSSLGRMLEETQPFNPTTSTRQVVMAGEDLVVPRLLELSQMLRQAAPGLRFLMTSRTPDPLDVALGRVDLALLMYPAPTPRSVESRAVGNLPWVVIAPADHPIPDRPTLEDWLSHAHVRVAKPDSEINPIDTAIGAEAAARRRIAIRVESFFQAMYLVGAGNLLFTTIGGMADPVAQRFGYRVLPAPFSVPPVPTALWHRPASTGRFADWLAKAVAPFHLRE